MLIKQRLPALISYPHLRGFGAPLALTAQVALCAWCATKAASLQGRLRSAVGAKPEASNNLWEFGATCCRAPADMPAEYHALGPVPLRLGKHRVLVLQP